MSSPSFRLGLLIAMTSLVATSAFQTPQRSSITVNHVSAAARRSSPLQPSDNHNMQQTIMNMASGDGTSKCRRCKRKKSTEDASSPATPSQAAAADNNDAKKAAALAAQLLAQEQMMYDEDDLTSFTPQKLEEDDRIAAAASKAGFSLTNNNDNTELSFLAFCIKSSIKIKHPHNR